MPSNTRKSGLRRPRQPLPAEVAARTALSPRARRGSLLALLLLLTAVALYCALITYDAADPWVMLARDSVANHPPRNLLGPPGAAAASALLLLFGAAAWVVPMVLIWLALAWLLRGKPLPGRALVGGAVVLVASACILAIQPWILGSWPIRWSVVGPGGVVGWVLGGSAGEPLEPNRLTELLQRLVGVPSGLILCGLSYLMGLLLLSGLHPRELLRQMSGAPARWRRRRKEKRLRELERALDTATAGRNGTTVSAIKRKAVRGGEGARRGWAGWLGGARGDEARRGGGSAGGVEQTAPLTNDEDDQPELLPEPLSRRRRAVSREESDDLPRGEPEANEPPQPRVLTARQRADLAAQQAREREGSAAAAPNSKSVASKSAAKPAAARSRKPELDFPGYQLPAVTLVSPPPPNVKPADPRELEAMHELLVETLGTFGVEVTPGEITRGPTVSRFEVYPAKGLRVSRIAGFDADLARATRAERVNILAPIPGKDTVGIEIANRNRTLVTLREILEDREFTDKRKKIPIAMGKDVYGNAVVGDLAAMPHLLVAGATGSGKSVCINAIISSILFRFSPDELRFLLIDPKVVEMQLYNKLPHLLFPVITEPKKVVLALRWVVNEMERRYRLLARVHVRNLDGFNRRDRSRDPVTGGAVEEELDEDGLEHIERIARAMDGEDDEPPPTANSELDLFADPNEPVPHSLPYIVVIIDELADLMQQARAEVEGSIQRITQKARAAGIHLIVATQTPRAEVITGTIKANIPSRIAFAVSNKIDSRVILDAGGAEKLVGKGDSLYLDPRSGELVRTQGCFVEDEEVEDLVHHCFDQAKPKFTTRLEQAVAVQQQEGVEVNYSPEEDREDDMVQRCIDVIRAEGAASTSLLQRRLSLGYTRAARMMDILEQRGIISPADGAKRRTLLIKSD